MEHRHRRCTWKSLIRCAMRLRVPRQSSNTLGFGKCMVSFGCRRIIGPWFRGRVWLTLGMVDLSIFGSLTRLQCLFAPRNSLTFFTRRCRSAFIAACVTPIPIWSLTIYSTMVRASSVCKIYENHSFCKVHRTARRLRHCSRRTHGVR